MKHETRNTVAILAWCDTCGKNTLHRVSDRRRGTCMEPHAASLSREQERRQKKQKQEDQNLKLF